MFRPRRKKTKSPTLYFENSVLFRKDAENIIFEVTSKQLPALKRIGLDDMFLTKCRIQVALIPKGWWHWITTNTDESRLLVNFNDGSNQFIEGSDVLRLTKSDKQE